MKHLIRIVIAGLLGIPFIALAVYSHRVQAAPTTRPAVAPAIQTIPSGLFDIGPALQAAGNAAPTGGIIILPATWTQKTAVNFVHKVGLNVVGPNPESPYSSTGMWQGPPNVPAIKFTGCDSPRLAGFNLRARKDVAALAVGIEFDTAPIGEVNAMHATIRNVVINGINGGIGDGVYFNPVGGDALNSEDLLSDCIIGSVTGAAVRADGYNVKNLVIERCAFNNVLYGYKGYAGVVMRDSGGYGIRGALAWQTSPNNQPLQIFRAYTESARRLLIVGADNPAMPNGLGVIGGTFTCSVDGARFDLGACPDGMAILTSQECKLAITNSAFVNLPGANVKAVWRSQHPARPDVVLSPPN